MVMDECQWYQKSLTYDRITETDDWVVEHCKELNEYRVSFFKDGHYQDEIIFKGVEVK